MRFRDRTDAGRQLATAVAELPLTQPIVLALPRGGLPVGSEVAAALDAPLEVLVVRKVGAPGQPEYGIGAIAEGGGVVVDRGALRALRISDDAFAALADRERAELDRRVERYRSGRPLPDVAGRDVVLVDDGLATGVTAEAAVRALSDRRPNRLVLAAPVCAPDTAVRLRRLVDVVCLDEPYGFRAVGQFYERFDQTTDDEVIDLLARAAARTGPTP